MICLRCKQSLENLGTAEKPLYSCVCGMQKYAINIYHPSDPDSSTIHELWHFVYLDGMAEEYNGICAEYSLWHWEAPDLCVCDVDQMSLLAGEYTAMLYGKPAIVVLSQKFPRSEHFSGLTGRVVLLEDVPERIAFNKNPQNWR